LVLVTPATASACGIPIESARPAASAARPDLDCGPGGEAHARGTTTALAPASSAARAVGASARLPETPKNTSPGRTRRESSFTPVIAAVAAP
jgi:hypothetical protein